MLDAYFSLPWQFQILVIEPLLGVVLGAVVSISNVPRLKGYCAAALLWNTVVMTLFLTGGATTSWQHLLYAGIVVLDSLMVFVAYGRPRSERERHPGFGFAFFGALYCAALISLLLFGR